MFSCLRRFSIASVSALILLRMAAASTLPELSFNEMTDSSEIVVSGHVTRTWTDWDAEHKYLWTHYELAVSAAHKGAAARIVDIAEPGGEKDGIGMAISGATPYHVGESVLVFLSRMPNGYLRTTGFGQGKYLVDAAGHVHGATALKTSVTRGGSPAISEIRSLDGLSASQVSQLVGARVRVHGGNAQ